MIADNIKNIDLYYGISKRLDKAFDYMKSCDFSKMEVGRYEVDGTEIYAMVQQYQTKLMPEGKWEAHKKYIDIQYIIKNKEQMGYAQLDTMELKQEYNADKDVLFVKGEGSYITSNNGDFLIFMPTDAHMPGITTGDAPEEVKKIVIKVLVQP